MRVGERSARPDDATEFVMADIPGLIEGAAEGRGLGHDFLRHVERARVLCVLLDLSELAPVAPEEQLAVLLGELGDYQADLLGTTRACRRLEGRRRRLRDCRRATISAVTGEGIDHLVGQLAGLVTHARRDERRALEHEVVVHRPVARGDHRRTRG